MVTYLLAFCLMQDVPEFKSPIKDLKSEVSEVESNTVPDLTAQVNTNTANIKVNADNVKANAENIEKIAEQIKKPIATGFQPPVRSSLNSFRVKPLTFPSTRFDVPQGTNVYRAPVYSGGSTGDSYVPDLPPAPMPNNVIGGGSTGNSYIPAVTRTRTVRVPVKQTIESRVVEQSVPQRTILPGKFLGRGILRRNQY